MMIDDDGPDVLASVQLTDCDPGRVLAAFTDPALLAQWWRADLETDLTPGGPYLVRFPSQDLTMRGEVVSYEPGQSLEFTWGWAHEPTAPRRTVRVQVSGAPVTTLVIRHGPHGDSEAELAERAGHHEGWGYFLPRLVEAVATASAAPPTRP
jgi:uncharacterized protein YndB with AHSA1/START domain